MIRLLKTANKKNKLLAAVPKEFRLMGFFHTGNFTLPHRVHSLMLWSHFALFSNFVATFKFKTLKKVFHIRTHLGTYLFTTRSKLRVSKISQQVDDKSEGYRYRRYWYLLSTDHQGPKHNSWKTPRVENLRPCTLHNLFKGTVSPD